MKQNEVGSERSEVTTVIKNALSGISLDDKSKVENVVKEVLDQLLFQDYGIEQHLDIRVECEGPAVKYTITPKSMRGYVFLLRAQPHLKNREG